MSKANDKGYNQWMQKWLAFFVSMIAFVSPSAASARVMLFGDEALYQKLPEGKVTVFSERLPASFKGTDALGIYLESRKDALDPEMIAAATASEILCFPDDCLARIRNTPLNEALLLAFSQGSVIAASGPGASMMGSWTLKGQKTVPGLGVLPKTMVDAQSNLERLLLSISTGSIGIALASDSIGVIEDGKLSVQGDGAVMVLETGGALPPRSAFMHILYSGDTYEPETPTDVPEPGVYRPGKPFVVAVGSDTAVDLPGVRDFVRASGGSGATPIILVSEGLTEVAKEWRVQLLRLGVRRVTILASNELSDERLSQGMQRSTGILLLDDRQSTLRDSLLTEGERYALYVREFADRLPVMAASGGRILGAGGLNLLPAVVCDNLDTPSGMASLLCAQMPERALGFGLRASGALTFNRGHALVTGTDSVLCIEPGLAQYHPRGDGLPAATGLLVHALPAKGAYDMTRRKARY